MRSVRRTKIVATIGPASDDPDTLLDLIDAGLDVARLNFAHGTFDHMAEVAERIRAAAERAQRDVAILQDLPGPKLRIGEIEGDLAELAPGEKLTLECGSDGVGNHERLTVSWAGLAGALEPGDVVYLADGAVRLRVREVREGDCEIDTTVEVGGGVTPRQGLNVPGELSALPAVAEEDMERLRFGAEIGVDLVALSFVRRPEEISDLRAHTDTPLIAKIEKPQAVDNLEAIAMAADGVMVARGDLGIELHIEDVPLVQKRIIGQAGWFARPVITATQMLDSMVVSTRPTRAEVTDVANAILDGTDAVMLSQETAIGAHPVAAVTMMDAIARATEVALPHERWINERVERVERSEQDPAYTVAFGACEAAEQLDLAALVVPTLSGRSARLISAHRPRVPIYAFSPDPATVRRCALLWGVQAGPMPRLEVTEELIADAARRVAEVGWVQEGERIGITAGLPSGRPGTTSLFQIQLAG